MYTKTSQNSVSEMGFQEMKQRRRVCTGYERLTSVNVGEKVVVPRRCHWVKKMNGRFRGFRVARSRRLNWKAFSLGIALRRRICSVYGELVKRLKMDGSAYPAILFSCQWGLPVLSHSTVSCRKTVVSYYCGKPVFHGCFFCHIDQ